MLQAAVLAAALAALHGVVVAHHANGAEEPVNGALVIAGNSTALTEADGSFEIDGLAPGRYMVWVKADAGGSVGYIDVVPRAESRKFLVLDPTCWALYGRVRDTVTGKPIAGATVNYLGVATTDANGDYFINWGCRSGPGFRFHNSFDWSVTARGYAPIDQFGGRAEYIQGVLILDHALAPVLPNPREPFRPSPIR